jgi:hypothetical protein
MKTAAEDEFYTKRAVTAAVILVCVIMLIVWIKRVHDRKLEYIHNSCSFKDQVHLYTSDRGRVYEFDRKYFNCPEGVLHYDEYEDGRISF